MALVNARKQAGITQQRLANALEKPQSYIAKIEKCERRLDVLEFIEWCEALRLKPADIIKIITYAKDKN